MPDGSVIEQESGKVGIILDRHGELIKDQRCAGGSIEHKARAHAKSARSDHKAARIGKRQRRWRSTDTVFKNRIESPSRGTWLGPVGPRCCFGHNQTAATVLGGYTARIIDAIFVARQQKQLIRAMANHSQLIGAVAERKRIVDINGHHVGRIR